MRGNYNNLCAGSAHGYNGLAGWGIGNVQNAVLSHYAYRGVPFTTYPLQSSGWEGPGCYPQVLRIQYVSPALTFSAPLGTDQMGCLFKTQKILGGRALVADAFGKNGFELATTAGPGYYAHRDGYNVLYGDWSAHWWGDPLQKFIWWTSAASQDVSGVECGGDTNVAADIVSGTSIANSVSSAASWGPISENTDVIQWHMLDLANGIDNLPTP